MGKNPGNKPTTLLAVRLSAMGDVAMTIPVMKQVLDAYPDLTIVFVTNKNWGALCQGIPRLIFVPADVKGEHKGVNGLFRLFRSIRAQFPGIRAMADLHQVLRSQILRSFFRMTAVKIAVIDKGRAGKKALTRKDDKILQPLTSTLDRYRAVFAELGYPVDADAPGTLPRRPSAKQRIGIAPFATYREKTYPIEKMEMAIRTLRGKTDADILLFGGGKEETAKLEALAARVPGVEVMAGKHSLEEELRVISGLTVMVSMDSANMHLASLYGVPVVSVWGATHPFAGFMGFGQQEENAVQLDLYCRPCSVFGSKPCYRGDHACMEELAPERIVAAVMRLL